MIHLKHNKDRLAANWLILFQASKFEIELLEGHNKCRAKHGVKPLQLDKKVIKVASQLSDKI